MAKFTHDEVLDAAVNELAEATLLSVCSSCPAAIGNLAAATLGSIAMTAGTAGADYDVANGDTSGRKLTVVAQSIASASATGTANHVVLSDASRILHCTTCPSQSITSGNPINVAAWDVEFRDPS